MKKVLFFVIILSLISNIISQEKWVQSRRTSAKPYLGKFVPLPDQSHNWENTNHSAKIINNGQEVFTIGPNFRVLPNSNQQDEVILVKSPVNPLIMFGSANTTASNSFGQGSYVTTDGGITWTGTDLIPSITYEPSDPAPAIDKNGNFILTTLNLGTGSINAVYSTNNGLNWQPNVIISALNSDKNFAASDDVPSSVYYGRTYTVWSNFQAGNPPIVISYTNNGGANWSSPSQINTPPAGNYSQGCDIAIGPAGQVYVCWAAPSNSTFIETFAGFAKSTNGGAAWTVNENIYDMNGIRASTFNGWNFRVNSFPRIAVDRSGGTRNGWIYIVQSQINLAPAGTDADIVLHKSTDGGATWSAGIRVNQDAMNNGKVQFFPAICVDNLGGIDICFYDNRNYPSVGDSCETFLAHSPDGGNTWIDLPVSDHRWKVDGEAGLQPYGGDYIGITSTNNKVWPFWYDNKTGSMQAWTCGIDLNSIGIQSNNSEIPVDYTLGQNYPNPFNPSTNIKFDIPKAGHVKIAVYDMLGNQVALLVNNDLKAGSYTTDFNASSIASGVYFYKLEANDFIQTKKMILTK